MIKYVIQYDASLSVEEMQLMYQYLKNTCPNEKIIFIPQTYIFKTFSIEEMIKVRDQMTKIIQEAQVEEEFI